MSTKSIGPGNVQRRCQRKWTNENAVVIIYLRTTCKYKTNSTCTCEMCTPELCPSFRQTQFSAKWKLYVVEVIVIIKLLFIIYYETSFQFYMNFISIIIFMSRDSDDMIAGRCTQSECMMHLPRLPSVQMKWDQLRWGQMRWDFVIRTLLKRTVKQCERAPDKTGEQHRSAGLVNKELNYSTILTTCGTITQLQVAYLLIAVKMNHNLQIWTSNFTNISGGKPPDLMLAGLRCLSRYPTHTPTSPLWLPMTFNCPLILVTAATMIAQVIPHDGIKKVWLCYAFQHNPRCDIQRWTILWKHFYALQTMHNTLKSGGIVNGI